MNLAESIHDDNLLLRLDEKRLDHDIAADFRDAVMKRATNHVGPVILDLTAVEFMDSSGLGAVVGIRKRLGWTVRIALAGLRSPVYRVFELARMTEIFTFYTSSEAALMRSHEEGAGGPGTGGPALRARSG